MKPEILHTPPNEATITEIYAVLSVDATGEGVCAVGSGAGMMPLAVAYPRMLPMIREYAAQIAKQTNRKLVLVKFTAREDMESFEP